MLVIFLFAIDATIVSTAMPTIAAKLGGLELYSWVFSIYMLTSALTTPLFGKLSDLYSQRRLMLDRHRHLCFRLDLVRPGAKHGSAGAISRDSRTRRRRYLRAVIHHRRHSLSRRHSARKCRASSAASGAWPRFSARSPAASSSNTGAGVGHFFVNLPITAVASSSHRHRSQRRPARSAAPTNSTWPARVTLMLALMLLFYALSRASHSQRTLDA